MSSEDTMSMNVGERVRYLCFSLGDEEFALPLLQVKTVTGLPEVTRVPNTPAYFMGIMNLRGQVISVLDMRKKLNIKPNDKGETAIIIVEFSSHQVGLVVDSINSVLGLTAQELQPRPDMLGGKSSEFVNSIYAKDERIVLILDVLKSLGADDRSAIEKTFKAA